MAANKEQAREIAELKAEVTSLKAKLQRTFRLYQESLETLRMYEGRFSELIAERDARKEPPSNSFETKDNDAAHSSQDSVILLAKANCIPSTFAPEFDLFAVQPSMPMDMEGHNSDQNECSYVNEPYEKRSDQRTTLAKLLARQKPLDDLNLASNHCKATPAKNHAPIISNVTPINRGDTPLTIASSSPDLLSPLPGSGSRIVPAVRSNIPKRPKIEEEEVSTVIERDGESEVKSQDLLESATPIQTRVSSALASTMEIPDQTLLRSIENAADVTRSSIASHGMGKLETTPPHKTPYVDVVRNRKARAALPGACCEECKAFYSQLARELHSDEDVQKMMDRYSRHRHQFKAPPTPVGYWDMWSLPPDESQQPSPNMRLADKTGISSDSKLRNLR